jgi:hypothetical protein
MIESINLVWVARDYLVGRYSIATKYGVSENINYPYYWAAPWM